ncbi:hypothetical protein Hanom_Chr04g00329331 [Helianthus anomalus]
MVHTHISRHYPSTVEIYLNNYLTVIKRKLKTGERERERDPTISNAGNGSTAPTTATPTFHLHCQRFVLYI